MSMSITVFSHHCISFYGEMICVLCNFGLTGQLLCPITAGAAGSEYGGRGSGALNWFTLSLTWSVMLS